MKGLAIVVLAATLLSGCAAAGLTVAGAGAGVAMGNGVEHTMTGIGYKTFTAPVSDVRLATLQSLRRMDIAVDSDAQTDDGWALSGTARDRTIEIELESLTGRTTRMRVVANKGQIFFKDAATSTEIILQTAQSLDELVVARAKEVPATAAKQAASKGGKRT
jgi:hypothetical protein